MSLDNRHLLALQLLESGQLTQEQIAQQVGVDHQTLRRWCSGDHTAGPDAVEFGEAYKALQKKQDQELEATRKKILALTAGTMLNYSTVKAASNDHDEVKLLKDIHKMLQEVSSPQSSVTNIYNIGVKTTEDALNEYRKLRFDSGVGRDTNDRGGVSEALLRGAAKVSQHNAGGKRVSKTVPSRKLSAKSKTEGVPSKQSSD
jgi:transcriptional regulator with XRE-family HTH domain